MQNEVLEKENSESSSEIWLDIKMAAKLKGVTPRAVRLAIKRGKYTARKIEAKGGYTYEILLSTLEKKYRELYLYTQTDNLVEKLEYTEERFIPNSAKEKALAKLDLLTEWRHYRNSKLEKSKADKEFIESYNSGVLYEKLFSIIGKVSKPTLDKWSKAIGSTNDWRKLVPNYSYGKKSELRTSLNEQEKNVFVKLLLHPNRFSIGKAIDITRQVLKKEGITDIPSDSVFRKYAQWLKTYHYDKWVLMRDGEKALKDNVAPHIIRNTSVLNVGDVLFADGHRFSFPVLNPFTGKPSRAVLLAFMDWKSGYIPGYEIMFEEDTQAIASALRNSIITMKMLPKYAYQDNGKSFRAKYFSNSDFRESGFTGIYGKLGIKTIFAKPYNARAKVIERFFLELQESFEKMLPCYTGSSIEQKPARLKRNEKFHKEIHEKLTGGYTPTIDEVKKCLDVWLDNYHDKICPNDKKHTIKEVFEQREKQNIDISALDDLMMAHEVKTIQRNGIRFLNTFYFNDALYGLKDRTIIKYSLFDLEKIKVYSTDGEFICTARRVTQTHPLAYHTGDVKDMQDFKYKIKKQAKLRRKTINSIKRFLPKEEIKFLEQEMIAEQQELHEKEQPATPKQISSDKIIAPVFLTDYERYDYLMKTGCTSQDERKWLENYRKSEEYKMIYQS